MKHRSPRSHAVALEYSQESATPTVTATGVGSIAEMIINIATEHGVPVHEDEKLAKLLTQSKVGEYVDPQTSRIVAEIICFLYELDSDWKSQKSLIR